MVSESTAKTQIKRLSRLRNFPSREDEKELRADLVKALQCAASDEAAVSIVDGWLEAFPPLDAPTVADLRQLAKRSVEALEINSSADVDCVFCHGTNWIIVAGPNDTTAAERCKHTPEMAKIALVRMGNNPLPTAAKLVESTPVPREKQPLSDWEIEQLERERHSVPAGEGSKS